jgi:CSLREA domain-containing protein
MKYSKLLLIPLFAFLGLTFSNKAYAATISVTETGDDNISVDNGECSLREAIISANTDSSVDSCSAGSGADQIVLENEFYLFYNEE